MCVYIHDVYICIYKFIPRLNFVLIYCFEYTTREKNELEILKQIFIFIISLLHIHQSNPNIAGVICICIERTGNNYSL